MCYCVEGFGGASGRWEEDEVGGQGVGFKEFVNEAFTYCQTDAADFDPWLVLCIQVLLVQEETYLFAPVMRTKSCSWGATFSQGAGVGS